MSRETRHNNKPRRNHWVLGINNPREGADSGAGTGPLSPGGTPATWESAVRRRRVWGGVRAAVSRRAGGPVPAVTDLSWEGPSPATMSTWGNGPGSAGGPAALARLQPAPRPCAALARLYPAPRPAVAARPALARLRTRCPGGKGTRSREA